MHERETGLQAVNTERIINFLLTLPRRTPLPAMWVNISRKRGRTQLTDRHRKRLRRRSNARAGCCDQTFIDRTEACFDLKPKRLAADTAYGTGMFLDWLVKTRTSVLGLKRHLRQVKLTIYVNWPSPSYISMQNWSVDIGLGVEKRHGQRQIRPDRARQ